MKYHKSIYSVYWWSVSYPYYSKTPCTDMPLGHPEIVNALANKQHLLDRKYFVLFSNYDKLRTLMMPPNDPEIVWRETPLVDRCHIFPDHYSNFLSFFYGGLPYIPFLASEAATDIINISQGMQKKQKIALWEGVITTIFEQDDWAVAFYPVSDLLNEIEENNLTCSLTPFQIGPYLTEAVPGLKPEHFSYSTITKTIEQLTSILIDLYYQDSAHYVQNSLTPTFNRSTLNNPDIKLYDQLHKKIIPEAKLIKAVCNIEARMHPTNINHHLVRPKYILHSVADFTESEKLQLNNEGKDNITFFQYTPGPNHQNDPYKAVSDDIEKIIQLP